MQALSYKYSFALFLLLCATIGEQHIKEFFVVVVVLKLLLYPRQWGRNKAFFSLF